MLMVVMVAVLFVAVVVVVVVGGALVLALLQNPDTHPGPLGQCWKCTWNQFSTSVIYSKLISCL